MLVLFNVGQDLTEFGVSEWKGTCLVVVENCEQQSHLILQMKGGGSIVVLHQEMECTGGHRRVHVS